MFGITIIVVVILMVMLYMGHIASRLASSAELATEPGRSTGRCTPRSGDVHARGPLCVGAVGGWERRILNQTWQK